MLCIDILEFNLGFLSTIVDREAMEDTEDLLVTADCENPEAIVFFKGRITWVLHTRAKKMRTP